MTHKILITIECDVDANNVENAKAIAETWITKSFSDLHDHGIAILGIEVESI